ncbi:MAG: peptidase T, partial [Saprospiraceae bacterium]|nr:peptidase T [Saprospiraceae bacterium]
MMIDRGGREEKELLNRFLRYVKIDTQADPSSSTVPSTKKQLNLSRLLTEECKKIGLQEVEMTEEGYVYATIAPTTKKKVPVLCFCAHVDTAPDCSGANVKPIVHRNYDGSDIVLPDDQTQIINPQQFPILKTLIGDDIITASGKTLLGADDKSGVAIIMQAAKYLIDHPEVRHGKIRILFTTDEEIGRGVEYVKMDKLGADFGYTLDGGPKGSFEDETFSADAVKVSINGVSAHPGYAKGKMENAMKIASGVVSKLPKRLSPERTSGRKGFIHPTQIKGELESTIIEFIIRDFETTKLVQHEQKLKDIIDKVLTGFPNSTYEFEVTEQYRNMKEVLKQHPEVSKYAREAIRQCGLKVKTHPIRGGTDGSRLSQMGLPCPNLFTGMHAIHSKQEWVSLQ